MVRKEKNKGITLITLVIMIIVLLILAGVTIASLTGDNGILGRAKSSSEKMHEASDIEQIELAVEEYKISKYTEPTGTLEDLLKQKDWCSNAIYDGASKTTKVTMKNCGHQYGILENGTITKLGTSKNNNITLSGKLPAGIYTLRYEDSNGVMTNYADICTLEIKGSGEDAIYEGLIDENCAPVGATTIGVYNSNGEKVDNIALGSLDSSYLNEKQYSFAAISDTHIMTTNETASNKFQQALQYMGSSSENIDFITICGDMATSGSDSNLSSYKSIVDTYATKPVYAISGNHEASNKDKPLSMNSLNPYTNQNLYYSFTKDNDIYIMLGISNPYGGNIFLDGELQWLYETLEANRNKRCFVFLHLYPRDGSGDAIDKDLEGDMLNNTEGKVFYSLLSHYSNVIYFHGHSHEQFEIQEINKMNNYDNIFGCHSVHIPSLGQPKKLEDSALVNYDGSEGYIVDVYENNIVLRGRDFKNGKFLPIASYCLDTTIKNVEANTYYDPLGIISNGNSSTLKSGSTWYQSSVNKNTITKISIVDNYSQTDYDESWDASSANNNQIMVYRKGTELTIVGNKYGISANLDATGMFSGFTNLTQINGLEKLNGSNTVKIADMFKNCTKLVSLNLSGFDNIKPETMQNVFSGCSLLTSIDISKFDLKDVNRYQNLFYNCSSLTEIKIPNNMSSNCQSTIFMGSMYQNCSSLTEIDMTVFSGKTIHIGSVFSGCTTLKNIRFEQNKITGLSATFENCSALENLDISGFDVSSVDNMIKTFDGCQSLKTLILPEVFDTNKVTIMTSMFRNCPLLSLDCSNWDTTNLTGVDSSFNQGSPGVIAPVVK